jgi:spectinomycin phosphotransferase
MLERPNISDETLIAALESSYGLERVAVEFLPLGNDARSSSFAATAADGRRYFLKVRGTPPYRPAVAIPRYLKDNGMEQIITPVPARSGECWTTAGGFTLILYPFVEGDVAMNTGLDDAQWIEYGRAVARIHSTALPPDLLATLPRESYGPADRWRVREFQARVRAGRFDDPIDEALARAWQEKESEIGRFVSRAEELARVLQERAGEFVLCHSDVHVANVLVALDGRLYIVDWDEPLLAPRERDLMLILGSGFGNCRAGPREDALFLEGYGEAAIDPLAFDYFRSELLVRDIAEYADFVFNHKDRGPVVRQDAVEGFKQVFA